MVYPRTHSLRRLLEILADVKGDDELMSLIRKYAIELRLLEEAYITSRYAAIEFRKDEVLKVKKAFDEVMNHV